MYDKIPIYLSSKLDQFKHRKKITQKYLFCMDTSSYFQNYKIYLQKNIAQTIIVRNNCSIKKFGYENKLPSYSI